MRILMRKYKNFKKYIFEIVSYQSEPESDSEVL